MRMKGIDRACLVQMFQRAGSHLLQLLARGHAQISLPRRAPPVHFRVDPPPDLHGSAKTKLHLARVLLGRVILRMATGELG